MIVDLKPFISKLIQAEFDTAHRSDAVYFRVENVEDLDTDIKHAMTAKPYNSTFLNDAEWVLIFGNKAELDHMTIQEEAEDDLENSEDEKKKEEKKDPITSGATVDTSDTGKLKIKIVESLQRIFKLSDQDKIELFDFVMPYEGFELPLFYAKLSFS